MVKVSAFADSMAVGGVQGELVSGVLSLIRRENTGELSRNLTLLAEPELSYPSVSEAVATDFL
jgi:hypothetical protein